MARAGYEELLGSAAVASRERRHDDAISCLRKAERRTRDREELYHLRQWLARETKAMRLSRPPTSKEFEQEELQVLRSISPEVVACPRCGWPVAEGGTCGTCGQDADKPVRKRRKR